MHPDVSEQLPQRFDALERRVGRVEQRLERVEERLDGIDHRLDRVEAHLVLHDGRFDALETQDVETRRYFGVLVESMLSEIRLVAEGVATNTAALQAFRVDTREQFVSMDRRLLRLEASTVASSRRPRRGKRN